MTKVPTWLKKHLKAAELERIERAVAEAEKGTSGEIVPMIVRQSSTTGHVPLAVLLVLVVIAQWFHVPEHLFELTGLSAWIWWVVLLVVAFPVSSYIAKFDAIERWFTPRDDQALQVNARAELEFYEHGIGQTRGATGILIFASLMEHRVVVLADRAISEKLPPETWQGVVALLTSGIRSGDLAEGFSRAIRQCGELLAGHFPADEANRNELRNHLIIKE